MLNRDLLFPNDIRWIEESNVFSFPFSVIYVFLIPFFGI